MKLENEFLVEAPLDQTWATLLDIRRVAQCLPGAQLDSDGADGVYSGSMKVKLGPMSLAYKGTARMAEIEEDAHSATIEVQAREQKGQGTASARIRNRLEPGPGRATHVLVQTDLNITGRPAQFGRGIMEDVAGKMLGDFAKRLEGEVLSGNANGNGAAAEAPSGVPAQPVAVPAPPSSSSAAEQPAELDLGAVLYGPLAKRAAIGLGVLVLIGVLRLAMGRNKDGLSITVRLR